MAGHSLLYIIDCWYNLLCKIGWAEASCILFTTAFKKIFLITGWKYFAEILLIDSISLLFHFYYYYLLLLLLLLYLLLFIIIYTVFNKI